MDAANANDSLRGRRILVVEDEYVIADELQRALQDAGSVVVGPAPSVPRALDLMEDGDVDLAVLDVNLSGERVYPLAEALTARGVAFVFVTGYDQSALPARFDAIPRCDKPVDMRKLTKILAGQPRRTI